MGLRDRLLGGLKRALAPDARPPAPAARPPQRPAAAPSPSAAPPASPPASAPPPATAPPASAPPPATAPPASAPPPAAAPPAAPRPPTPPASLLPHGTATDAPVRGAHLPPRVQAASGAAVEVSIETPAVGLSLRFPVEPGERVLDAAERAGHELPSSCRSGGCLSCSALLLAPADTEMEEQYVLDDEHLAAGYRLLCITTLRTPARFRTHVQDDIQ